MDRTNTLIFNNPEASSVSALFVEDRRPEIKDQRLNAEDQRPKTRGHVEKPTTQTRGHVEKPKTRNQRTDQDQRPHSL